MPIRWYAPSDPSEPGAREDPTYRHFERIVNLTLHGALFAAVTSGLWVVQELRHPWTHLGPLTLIWAAVLVIHGSVCLLYTSPSPRDATLSRMPSSA